MTTATAKKRPKKKSNTIFLPLFLALVIVGTGIYFFSPDTNKLLDESKKINSESKEINSIPADNISVQQPPSEASSEKRDAVHALIAQEKSAQQPEAITPSSIIQAPAQTEKTTNTTEEKPSDFVVTEPTKITRQKNDITQESSLSTSTTLAVSKDTVSISPSQAPQEAIIAFYNHLDQQKYLVSYNLGVPSEQYFSKLLQKVVDNPPIVRGEIEDLFNILQNTAHFFRIFGKKDITLLKKILDEEKDSFEDILAQFYQMTAYPEQLKARFGITLPQTAIYDYAGFFLTTMGGRLYLFRRDSTLRMTINYYSILIVDKANDNGENSHGIDILPAIKQLISELENGGASLKMQTDYLDTLYTLKDKYDR